MPIPPEYPGILHFWFFDFFFYFDLLFLYSFFSLTLISYPLNPSMIIVQRYQYSRLRKSIPSRNQNTNFSYHTRVSPRGGIAVLHEDKGKCKGSTDLFPIVSPRWAESGANVLWDVHVSLVLPKGVKLTLGRLVLSLKLKYFECTEYIIL